MKKPDSKTEQENLYSFGTKDIKGFLKKESEKICTLTWQNSLFGHRFQVRLLKQMNEIQITYDVQDLFCESVVTCRQRIPIVDTCCHLGGKRFWFLCPGKNEDKICQKRVGRLYLKEDAFACRHCHELTYSSKNKRELKGLFRELELAMDLESAAHNVKKSHYRGKLTKPYSKYLKIQAKLRALSDFTSEG